jgi:hypothetical protein
MAYGTVKVDNIVFDDGGSDQTVTVSGLYNSLTSGITVTGTISGAVVIGSTSVSGTTVAGVTVTGTTVQGASGTFTSLTGTTIQGTTATYTTGSFTSLTGTTTTGTTANFVSGVFTTSVSGTTVIAPTGTFTSLTGTTTQGTTAIYTTGSFTSLTGTTTTGTTSSFTSGVFTTLSGATATFTSGIIASGTAAAPSLAILGDPNTGIFSPGADQVAVATNGAGRLFINSTGQVSINTASDGIGFAQIRVGTFATSQTPNGYFLTASAGALASNPGWIGGLTLESDAGGTPSVSLVAPNSTTAGAQTYQKAFETAGGGAGQRSVIYAGGTERLRITPAGLVGIGTSSPNVPLEVVGNIHMSGAADRTIFNRANNALSLGTNNTTRLHITNAGNVGIGTTSPENLLHVAGSGAGAVIVERTGNTLNSHIEYKTTSGSVYAGQGNANAFAIANSTNLSTTARFAQFSSTDNIFYTSGSERARIDSSGRLLVGTSTNSALSTLVLQGNSTSSNGAPFLFLQRGVSVPGADDALGVLSFGNNASNLGAQISVSRDGGTWTSGTSHPGRLVFSVTADGAASPTEALRISNNRAITVSDGGNVVLGTTTGTKIGTATTQKLGFYNATPVVQPAAVANATDAATVITQLNDLLAKLRTLGIIAT